MREGVDVRGYFVWSLLDNWEWAHGMSARFGLVRTEPGSLARVPKASATFYMRVVKDGGFNGTGALLYMIHPYETREIQRWI